MVRSARTRKIAPRDACCAAAPPLPSSTPKTACTTVSLTAFQSVAMRPSLHGVVARGLACPAEDALVAQERGEPAQELVPRGLQVAQRQHIQPPVLLGHQPGDRTD